MTITNIPTIQKYLRFSLVFLIFLLNYSIVYANNSNIDSLKRVLTEVNNDSIKYEINLNIALQLEAVDFDSAIIYYNNCIDIADTNNWTAKKAQAFINIGYAYMYSTHSKGAEEFLSEGLKLYMEANDSLGILRTYYNLGYFYGTYEDFPKAIENFRKAEEFAQVLNHEKLLASIYNNLGLMYNYIGQYYLANKYNFKSLKLSEKNGNKSVGYTHINIGLNYQEEGNLEESIKHHFNALAIFQESGEKSNIALSLKSIGDDYFDYDLDSAIRYYNKAYLIYKELNDIESISRHFMLLGNINYKQNNFKVADSNYIKAINIFPANGSRKLLFSIYSNIVELNLHLIDINPAYKLQLLKENISYSKKMNEIAVDIGSLRMETESYEKLYKSYMKIDNSVKAIKYAEKYIIAKDSLFSEQKQKAIIDLQTKYETDKKELEIHLLNTEKELINTKLEQSDSKRKMQMITIYLLIIGFVSIIVFIIIILKFYRQTKRTNNKLVGQNSIILKQKEEKEVLLKEIHHRVKNNLQLVSSLLNLQTQNIEDESIISAIADGQSRIEAMVLIHQKLYQGADISSIDFKDYTLQLLNQISGLYPELKDVEKKVIASNIKLDIDTSVPVGLILSELIINAFKYSFASKKGSISITLTKDENDYTLVVHDSGPGLPKDFDPSTTSSIGLHLVRRLSRQLYGSSRYEYENGSKFIISFTDNIGRKKKE